MSIEDYAKQYSNRHWEKMMWYAGLPVTMRMRGMLAEMQQALENNNKGLAKRWAKSMVQVLTVDNLIPETGTGNEISSADSVDKMVDKILTSVQLGMQVFEEKGDPANWSEPEDDSIGTRSLMDLDEDLDGTGADNFGPVELDFSALEDDEEDDGVNPGDNNNPPPGPGGDGSGGDAPGGDRGGPGGPPSGDDSDHGSDDKKSEKTAKGDISKLDVGKVAQAIRDNGKKAGREMALDIAQTLIDDGNGFPIEDLANELYRRAELLIVEEDAAEEEAKKEAAKLYPQFEEDKKAAQSERNTMDRVARENAAEDRTPVPMDDFWNDSGFQAVRADILKADAEKRVKDSQRLLREALEMANAWSRQYSTGEQFTQRQILEHVFPAQRMQEFDERMERAAQAETGRENTGRDTMDRADRQMREEETRDARLSDFQIEFDNIDFALAENDQNTARREAEALARKLQNVRGQLAGLTADQILRLVGRAQQRRREDVEARDQNRAAEQIDPEDSVSQQGGLELPGGAVRNVAMALQLADEARAIEVARRTAEKIQDETRGTVEEIAKALLEAAREDVERQQRAREADENREGRDEQPAQRNGNGFLAHVTDVNRFMKFDRMFSEVAQMVANRDPKMMQKAKALVKTFQNDKKIFTEGATPEAFMEFCIRQARAQKSDEISEIDGAENQDGRGGAGAFSIPRALRENSALATSFQRLVGFIAKGDEKTAASLALRMATMIKKTYGLTQDAKAIAKELLELARKAAKRQSVASIDSDSDSKPNDDGSQGSGDGMRSDQGKSGTEISLTMRNVNQTNWPSISTLYFDDPEDAEEMKEIAAQIVKKGADNAAVQKSAKDLLAKSKKAKKGAFKNFRHVIAAIKDAVVKKAMGKKVTKPLKASDIPDEKEDKKAA
ncbi:MAG: hypothetical protein AAGF44_00230 [Pseudomonadota bacterium]